MSLRWVDLGALGDRVLVFGGPYSNAAATEALFDQARRMGFAPGQVICTGDTVAYCAEPEATVAMVRAFGGPVIAGNCERQLARGDPSCGCGFTPGTTCDLLSAGWYSSATDRTDAATRNWMADLPDFVVFSVAGKRHAVVHGGATDVSCFLWPSSENAAFEAEIKEIERIVGPVDAVVAGHSGLAFHRRIGGIDWINAGAIGMPAHDGRPETRFATISGEGPVFHRLKYDFARSVAAMSACGLTQGYHDALRTGFWPSEDALPPELRVESSPRVPFP